MSLTNNEQKTLYSARLRNLKRKYAKLSVHADLIDETLEVKSEIKNIEDLLSQL